MRPDLRSCLYDAELDLLALAKFLVIGGRIIKYDLITSHRLRLG